MYVPPVDLCDNLPENATRAEVEAVKSSGAIWDQYTRQQEQPQSLQHLCMSTVRSQMSWRTLEAFQSLELPETVVDQLTFKDVALCLHKVWNTWSESGHLH